MCTTCPDGSTCDGTKATACDKTKYVKDNVCTTCPDGSTCDGTKATAYDKTNGACDAATAALLKFLGSDPATTTELRVPPRPPTPGAARDRPSAS